MEPPESSRGRKAHTSRSATWAERSSSRPTLPGSEPWLYHLLVLAQDGTPDGAHLHLEENNGLEEGSASLVLERCDDE
ncbi:Imm32 family immunity protein [Streptomyces lasalocidi]